jgi:hypothetical protein
MVLGQASDQKIMRLKNFLEFNFREGIFYAKNLKHKILKDPQFGRPLGPQGGLRSKDCVTWNVLRIWL